MYELESMKYSSSKQQLCKAGVIYSHFTDEIIEAQWLSDLPKVTKLVGWWNWDSNPGLIPKQYYFHYTFFNLPY